MRRAPVLLTIPLLLLTTWSGASPARAEQAGGGTRAAIAGQIDVGNLHACAVERDGDVRCWGSGSAGRTGARATDARLDGVLTAGNDEATIVPLGGPAESVSVSYFDSCAVLRSGAVRCWGQGTYGMLGSGATDSRLDGSVDAGTGTDEASTVPLDGDAKAVSVGWTHACALMDDGAVRCWGYGGNGQLGSGAMDDRLDGAVDPSTGTDDASTVDLGEPATAVSAGANHTCALMRSGVVRCWGGNFYGELGANSGDQRLDGDVDPWTGTDEASTVDLGEPTIAIAAGAGHTCAVAESGAVRCWGLNDSGQLGDRSTIARMDGGGPTTPSIVDLGEPAVAVTADFDQNCAITAAGAVRCWGNGANGRLGSGAGDNRLEGVIEATGTDEASTVPLSGAASAVAMGVASACAIERTTSAVRCWGAGSAGRLGSRGTASRLSGAGQSASTVPVDPTYSRVTSLSLDVIAPPQITIGQEFTLLVELNNDGPDDADALDLAVNFPSDLQLVSVSPDAGTYAAPVWSVPGVPNGGARTLTVRAVVPAPAPGLALSAEVSGGDAGAVAGVGRMLTDLSSTLDLAPLAVSPVIPAADEPAPIVAPAAGGAPVRVTTGRVAVRGSARLLRRSLRVGQRTTLRLHLINTGSTRSTATRSCVRLSRRLELVGLPTRATLTGRLLCFGIPQLEPGADVVRRAQLRATGVAQGAVARDGTRDQTAITNDRITIDR